MQDFCTESRKSTSSHITLFQLDVQILFGSFAHTDVNNCTMKEEGLSQNPQEKDVLDLKIACGNRAT